MKVAFFSLVASNQTLSGEIDPVNAPEFPGDAVGLFAVVKAVEDDQKQRIRHQAFHD